MCGILAVINFDHHPVYKDLFLRMRDTMVHRGPDDAGIYLQGGIGLAHRRLSIIDLSATGHQPMSNEDDSVHIVFNGEIYNHVELRNDLIKKGHAYRSTSDTETILHQYEEDGERCVEKFNGMFAFVLWDRNRKMVFAARDRLGIKPLYYFMDEKRFIMASEIKAILEDPSVPRLPDHDAIADYFFSARAYGNKTLFQGVREVEPGYALAMEDNGRNVRLRKYWDVVYRYDHSRSHKHLTGQVHDLLEDAVRIHCRSDAPLGCHLSGGLDSSSVVAFAARHRKPLKTFSIKFSDEDYIDETKYAIEVARHVGAEYIESSPNEKDLAKLIPFLIWHMDMPMSTDGGFSYYTASQLAHRHVKVSLTGHGGDELFAGYPAQFRAAYHRTDMFNYRIDPNRIFAESLWKKISRGMISTGVKGAFRKLRNRLVRHEGTIEDMWVQLHCESLPENNPLFHRDFVRRLGGYSPRDEYIKPFSVMNTDQALDKCLYHDLRVYLPSLLHLEDRVSMALSIESRVPLLDYRIVELLATVPPAQKVGELVPKYLLREAVSGLLPESICRRRDKFPFPVPGRFWFSKEVKQLVDKVLLSPGCLQRGIFSPDAVKEVVSQYDLERMFQLLNVELWFKIFIDQDPDWLSQARTKA